jgi:hypothetical protein
MTNLEAEFSENVSFDVLTPGRHEPVRLIAQKRAREEFG